MNITMYSSKQTVYCKNGWILFSLSLLLPVGCNASHYRRYTLYSKVEQPPKKPHIFCGLVYPLSMTGPATDWAHCVSISNSRVAVG